MPFETPPIPIGDPVVGQDRRMTQPWIDWFGPFTRDVDAAPARIEVVTLTTQGASISATPIASSAASGLFRVSWYARITRAGTVSSSLTVTIAWLESAVSLSTAGAAMTGNTTATVQSGSALVRIDAGSITYAASYASVGATSMQFRLDIVVEQVAA